MSETYLMRSLMFVPAHNQKLLDSAVKRDADVLLLDIEDSVPSGDQRDFRDPLLWRTRCRNYSYRSGNNGAKRWW